MISVIVPVFNSEVSIKNCIESILNQTYQNFEIIIVYKKSNDNTLEIIKSIKDNRIRIIFQTEDSGPGGARNIGVSHSNGDFIGFVEADDIIEKCFFEKLHKRIIDDLSCIAWGEIKLNNKLWTFHQDNSVKFDFLDKYKLVKNGASFDKLFRSNLIKNNSIKFIENFRFEDNPFLLKSFFYSKKISLVKNAFYYYNPKDHSKEYKGFLKKSIIPNALEMINFAKENNLKNKELKLIQRKIIRCFASSFVYESDVYHSLMSVMGNPFFLRLRYLKKTVENSI